MGMEAYLFEVYIKRRISGTDLIKILNQLGFKSVNSESKTELNFELVLSNGIIEAQVCSLLPFMLKHQRFKEMFVRVCISNSIKVIEDLLRIFKRLARKISIDVYDMQLNSVIDICAVNDRTSINREFEKRKFGVEELYGKVNKPVRCADYWTYVEEKGLGRAKWTHTYLEKRKTPLSR